MIVANVIGIVAIVLIVGGAAAYIIRAKKRGARCIGCPDSKTCAAAKMGGCGGCSGACGGHCEKK